jgi:uncharacterized protein
MAAAEFSVPTRGWMATAVVCLAVVAGSVLVALSAWRGSTWRAPALAVVGIGLGFVLFQSTFGFSGSFRAAIERYDFAGFRAQAGALFLTSAVFFPILNSGTVFGHDVYGFAAPIGVSFVTGAILFGIGMQLGGGCASGTLFALGGGNIRLLVTLGFFIVGSALGAAHLDFWWRLPSYPAVTTQAVFGAPLALLIHLTIFAAIIRAVPDSGPKPAVNSSGTVVGQILREPWSLSWGAVGLATLNGLTLVLAGRPWGETSGFTLWGSKIALLLGWDASAWPYWRADPAPLFASLFSDITTVMDFGIIIGALLASGISRRFELRPVGNRAAWYGAAFGGLLMGYGARLSDGCNIGAYFSALASGSVSGWAWVAAAFVGSAIGLRMRSFIEFSNTCDR